MRSMIRLCLLSSFLGCAVPAPSENGTIVARCIIQPDGAATAVDQCPVGQDLRCLPGTDAGNGQVLARCCPTRLSDEVCTVRAGLSDGGPPADR